MIKRSFNTIIVLKLCILSDDITDSCYLTDTADLRKVSHDDEPFKAQLQDTVSVEFKLNSQQIVLALLTAIQIVSMIHDNSSISDFKDAIQSLPLPDCINAILVDEFEYQVDLYFDKYIEPTIDYKKLNEFWLITLCVKQIIFYCSNIIYFK